MHSDQIPQVLDTAQALAEAVAADGFDAHLSAVTELVADARRGICELLAAVALDAAQPVVVRNGPSASRRFLHQRGRGPLHDGPDGGSDRRANGTVAS